MNVFEYFQSFEIYSNPPYRIVVVIIITQIISESEGHTILLSLFLLFYTHMLVILHVYKLREALPENRLIATIVI